MNDRVIFHFKSLNQIRSLFTQKEMADEIKTSRGHFIFFNIELESKSYCYPAFSASFQLASRLHGYDW